MTRDRFLLYAPQDSGNLASEMGRADYSYWFVLDYFRRMLATSHEVVVLSSPGESVAEVDGVRDLRMLFMPPHAIPLELASRSIPVFAWEYSTIPTESWGEDPRHDWREVLSRAPGAITHSTYSAAAVRDAMGDAYRIAVMPAPVWDDYAPILGMPRATRVHVEGAVLDSWALGLQSAIDPAFPAVVSRSHDLQLSGTVFTLVANPDDGRKVWGDAVSAFAVAHRDNPDATLIVKVVHFDRERSLQKAWEMVRRLAPFQCRVVLVHAFLEGPDFRDLVAASHFVVNSSVGEGQCLPLMEFMSAGVPAVAPAHTAMADYVTGDNAFVVEHAKAWTHWPHDARRFLRCFMHPVAWDSMHGAFIAAEEFARTKPDAYLQMRVRTSEDLRQHCSREVVSATMAEFASGLPGA